MSKTKRILAFALAAVLAVVVLTGCKSIVQKVFGSSNEVQEDDTTQWAVLSSDPLMLNGIADTTAKYATARANGALNIVFNGIWSRKTEYFTVPSGLLSIYGCGTTDGGAQKFKVSLWKKVDGGAQYVDNTTFYFTADGRVDFRELVKDLAGIFHTRIELRQIGVRDESKMIGGLGICGQPFCCSRFLKDFQPVSIKMAKEQGLSLNPTKISGACGRLMCCLSYEENAYEYLNSIMPMVGSTVRTPDGLGTVLEVNPISGYLRVRCGTEALTPRYYKVGVCEYISGGKRAPRRPDPDDDYSGVRNPAPVVASSDDEKRPACPRRRNSEKE